MMRDKVKRLLSRIEAFLNQKAGLLRGIILILLGLLILLVLIFLFAKTWVLILLGGFGGIYIGYNMNRREIAQSQLCNWTEIIREVVFHVVNHSKRSGLIPTLSAFHSDDIHVGNVYIGGMKMFRSIVEKSSINTLEQNTIKLYAKILQSAIADGLGGNVFAGVPYNSIDGKHPVLAIYQILDLNSCIALDIAVLDSLDRIEKFSQLKKQQKRAVFKQASSNDSDF